MIQQMRMDEFEDARPGVLLGVTYSHGVKTRLPVRVGVELREQRFRPDKNRWDWAGLIVKCSPVLESELLGNMIFVNPDDCVMVF